MLIKIDSILQALDVENLQAVQNYAAVLLGYQGTSISPPKPEEWEAMSEDRKAQALRGFERKLQA